MNVKATFGAKPTVLRCSRCGKFVDWEEARLQVVCGCRAHLDLPPVLVRITEENERAAVADLFRRDFGRTRLVSFGEQLQLDSADSLVARLEDDIAGALAYRVRDDRFDVLALATDPMWQRSGVGAYLVAEAELMAARQRLRKVAVSTTNDNLPSLYFYQRRGYRITGIVVGAMPQQFPEDTAIGFAGIPIRDEIHLEKDV